MMSYCVDQRCVRVGRQSIESQGFAQSGRGDLTSEVDGEGSGYVLQLKEQHYTPARLAEVQVPVNI